tara:strand:- start:61 stop:456 length:396 start_codon:yes stop_codon:yes gene_type:complete
MSTNNKSSLLNSNKTFGILFFIIFLLYGIWPIFYSNDIRIWSLIVGLIFLILGLLNSKILTPLNNAWIKFGELLGKIISPLVMGFIFFLVITPISLIMKLFRKDLLNLKYQDTKSYWIKRSKNKILMKKQY